MVVRTICPNCGKEFGIEVDNEEEFWGSCFECPRCDLELLANRETKTVKDFHRALHERDPHWPIDGRGTGFLDINSDGSVEITIKE